MLESEFCCEKLFWKYPEKLRSSSIFWKVEVVFHFVRTDLDSVKLVYQLLESQFCCKQLFWYYSGRVGSGRVGGNSDNKANSAQFQVKLPTGAELGNNDCGTAPGNLVLIFIILHIELFMYCEFCNYFFGELVVGLKGGYYIVTIYIVYNSIYYVCI